ncbi:MAG: agmatinase [Pseudomonadota bacterium]|jgi:agmatinase|nr:agmatinase [Rubrivivax sp.]MCA3259975.1 agmatinase [Rubrivivax sp.]MCZ8029677.1 agmatinase [Rubrivivax sp.]
MNDRHVIDALAAHAIPYLGVPTFLRLPATRHLAEIDVAVVGLAYDLGVSNRTGARFGPRGVREQSLMVGQYAEGLWPWEYDVRERLRLADWGDVPYLWGERDEFLAACAHHLEAIWASDTRVLGLGGDHFVFLPLIRAAARRLGPLAVVHFDAHDDCLEMPALNHATMFHHACEEGLIDPGRTVHVGIRTPPARSAHPYHYIDGRRTMALDSTAIASEVRQIVGDGPVYVTFDIDFVDPAFAPGTGTCCVGGVGSFKAREIVRALRGLNVVAADLVEVSPPLDSSAITQLLGAALATDLLYLMAEAPRPWGAA